ncbi:MAG: gliding motility-associated C-terminal domain-containing protein [Bacteroidales bacterium]
MQKWSFLGIAGLALLLFQPLCAQKEGAVWYFGNHAGLDFKEQYPKPLAVGQTNSSEGVSAISDKDGNLLFYTDGQIVYTSSHQVMTNGQGLYGNNSSTQSSIIVPWPNHPRQYYVFTVGKVGTLTNPHKGLYYSIVDMNSNRVDSINFNVKLLETCTEKITAIKHNNGNDWWILAHEIDQSVFYRYLLSDDLLQQEYQSIGLKHTGATGYLKASPDGDFVALATEGVQDLHFEVFKFDNKYGKLLPVPLPIKLQAEFMYGVEFSPTGKYLYGTNRQDGIIYRWKLDDFSQSAVEKNREIIFSDPNLKCGALQLALNGKIYVAFNNQPYLGVINAPDLDSGGFVKRGASLFDYTTNFKGISGFGLPNFPSVYFKNDIYYSNTCVNDSTVFYLASKDLFDSPPTWYINGKVLTGDELTYQVKYVFKNPFEDTIKVEGSKNGDKISYKRLIQIHPLPVLDIKDTTYLCAGQPVELHNGNYAFYGITNETGEYSDTIRTIDQPGLYTVTATNYQGCTKKDSTRAISKAQPKIERSPKDPVTVCPGDTITLTATGAESYIWEHEPGKQQNSVIVYPDSTTTFKVTGSNGGTCFGYDSIRIQVFKNNKLNLGPDLTPCAGDIVVLRGKDYAPGSVYTEWNWSTGGKTDSLIVLNSLPNLSLRVKDINGCSYKDSINIAYNPPVVVKIERSPDVSGPVCPGEPITLKATGADSYIWEHDPGVHLNSVIVYPDRDTIFKVTGSNGGQCFGSDSIQIEVFPNHKLYLGPDSIACSGDTVVLRGKDYDPGSVYTEWNWSTGGKTDSLIVLNSLPNLSLSVKDINGCLNTDTIKITFNPLPVISSVVKKDITCFGDGNGSLEITVDGNQSINLYSIDDGESWSEQRLYTNLPSGNYVARVRFESGCMSLAYPVTIIEPEPIEYQGKSIAPSCPDCTDGEIQINVTGGTKPYSFDWDGFNIHDSVFSDIGADTYVITITDANGCEVKFEYPLVAGELIIPNAFSPNGGNKNEKWVIRILDNRPDCLVQVYDRSGKLVFYDDKFYEPWDGTYLNQGKKLPAGTYFYLIQIDRKDANKPPQRGTVTILR